MANGLDIINDLLYKKSNPPIDVVPDNALKSPGQTLQTQQLQQTPQYGAEANLTTAWTQPLSALLDSINKWRAQTPLYVPFAPGTPTLEAKKLAENIRQFNESLKYQYAELAQSGSGGSSGSGSSKGLGGIYDKFGSTGDERTSLYTTGLTAVVRDRYLQRYKASKEQEKKTGQHGYPLEETLLDLFLNYASDPDMIKAGSLGADLCAVADYLVARVTGESGTRGYLDYADRVEKQLMDQKRELEPLAKRGDKDAQKKLAVINKRLKRLHQIDSMYKAFMRKKASGTTLYSQETDRSGQIVYSAGGR